jgi:hypothetical protein
MKNIYSGTVYALGVVVFSLSLAQNADAKNTTIDSFSKAKRHLQQKLFSREDQ